MKIKTNKRWALGAFFAFALLLGGGYYLINSSSLVTYALTEEGYPETLEEFEAQLDEVHEKRAELQEKLDTIREYGHVQDYQEIWDVLERYIATEEIGEWGRKYVSMRPFLVPGAFTYSETLLNELVATIQKYDPDFRVASDIEYNNIVSSLPNSTITEISIVGYDMLYIGHIDMMLANAQEYYDKNSNSTKYGESMVKFFVAAVNDEFEDCLATYGRMAELYNRIMSRDSFAKVHAIFKQWLENYREPYSKLRTATYILQHGEELTAQKYFPDKIRVGMAYSYFDKIVASSTEGLGKAEYTLEELVIFLPSLVERRFPEIGKEAIVTLFREIFAIETQNLKDALQKIDPTLTNLDDKTIDELIELGNQYDAADVSFDYLYENASPEVKELISLLIEFNTETLNLFVDLYPTDKYLSGISTASLLMTYAEIEPVDTLIAEQIQTNASSRADVYDYYGKIGKAAATIDPTVIYELYPHEDWPEAVAPGESDDPKNPSSSNTHPNSPGSTAIDDPAAPSQNPSDNSSTEQTDSLLPNTGVIRFISNNATATIGIIAFASALLVFSIRKIKRFATRNRE